MWGVTLQEFANKLIPFARILSLHQWSGVRPEETPSLLFLGG